VRAPLLAPDINLRRAFCAAQLAFGCATSPVRERGGR